MLKEGDIARFIENGLLYRIEHIHKMYKWIKAVPHEHNGQTLYNKLPKHFEAVK